MRRGRQEPRRVYRDGEVAYSEVDDAVALGEDLGISPFPWQRYILTDWCEFEVGFIVRDVNDFVRIDNGTASA